MTKFYFSSSLPRISLLIYLISISLTANPFPSSYPLRLFLGIQSIAPCTVIHGSQKHNVFSLIPSRQIQLHGLVLRKIKKMY